jgi:glycine oxidase
VSRAEIIVVGSGLTGLTTAHALQRAGHRVMVINAGDEGDAGVAAVPPWQLPDVLENMARYTCDLLPELVVELGQATGVDCEIHESALLLVAEAMEEAGEWLKHHQHEYAHGPVADFEPGLAFADRNALQVRIAHRVRPSRLARALAFALPQTNVSIIRDSSVRRLDVAGNIVLGVELADGRRYRAEAVVMAAGARTNPLLFDSGLERLTVDPHRTTHLLFNPGQRLISQVVHGGDCCLAPLADGRLMAVDLTAGQECEKTAIEDLYARVSNWLPALSRFDLENIGLGPKPGLETGLPAIGAYPQMRGLWVNAGHLRRGLEISLAAGELLADQMNGAAPVSELVCRFESC